MTCCHSCKKPVDAVDRVGRTDTCPNCGADLHCCRNCRFHDPGSYNQCREPQAERVVDKESGNFCDCFVFIEGCGGRASATAAKRNPLDDLFKK